MKYRNLGKHGVKVSEISIGTMYYGSKVTKENALKCLEEAYNQGINHIDNADRYGLFDDINMEFKDRVRAEAIVGEFFKDHNREDFVISSKVWFKMRESVNSGGLSRKHIREGIQDSLKHLQMDYLDFYYCHRPDPTTSLEETISVMTNLIDEGLIHYWGTSRWPATLIERTIGLAKKLGMYPPNIEQPKYHLFERYIEIDILELANYHGLGLIAYQPLAGGVLTGKYLETIPKASRAAKSQYQAGMLDEFGEKVKHLAPIAESLEIPLNQFAIAWALQKPEISSIITGASKPEQVKSNSGASGIDFTLETLEKIEEILQNKPRSRYR
ncbi:MAG: aldo/keto reductase [Candidatus Heimdallarchaeota archaeon]|nr:aldo/keto reductase [Candidatus Heimdallarchaeota archaeon]